MDDLISRKYLYDEIAKLEDDARTRVMHTPKGSPEYLVYKWQLDERSALKHEIMDAPSVTDTNVGGKWIPIGQYPAEPSLMCFEDGTMCVGYFDYENEEWDIEYGSDIYIEDEPIAWMPLPEPYKGE